MSVIPYLCPTVYLVIVTKKKKGPSANMRVIMPDQCTMTGCRHLELKKASSSYEEAKELAPGELQPCSSDPVKQALFKHYRVDET